MEKNNRRAAVTTAVLAGTTLLATNRGQAQDKEAEVSRDEQVVMEAGLTREEAECWRLTAAAGAFFKLPELHSMDATEVASAIHVIQNKLLARPTYRKYLETAKAAAGEKAQ